MPAPSRRMTSSSGPSAMTWARGMGVSAGGVAGPPSRALRRFAVAARRGLRGTRIRDGRAPRHGEAPRGGRPVFAPDGAGDLVGGQRPAPHRRPVSARSACGGGRGRRRSTRDDPGTDGRGRAEPCRRPAVRASAGSSDTRPKGCLDKTSERRYWESSARESRPWRTASAARGSGSTASRANAPAP